MEIIIKNNSIEELTKSVAVLLAEEKDLENKLKSLQRIKSFYKEEINSVKDLYHTTKLGEVKLISEMDDNHLLNTATLFSKNGNVSKKYLNEIKKRGLAGQYFSLLDAKNINNDDNEDGNYDREDEYQNIWGDKPF